MVKNPLKIGEHEWPNYSLADPFLLRHDGWYYLYGTAGQNQGVRCWKSQDLASFEYAGIVCNCEEVHNAYAPEVTYVDGMFYMVASPKGKGHYILKSDSPIGPFEMTGPNIGQSIDGSMFVDDDGSMYFFRASFDGIVAHKMKSPTEIEAQGKVVENSRLNHWTEGPMVLKREGFYYMTITGNHFLSRGYRVAYMVSKEGPDRGYVQLEHSILLLETGDEHYGLGHSASVLAPSLNGDVIVYHQFEWIDGRGQRGVNIDRLFRNKARMLANTTWWPQPSFDMPDVYGRGLRSIGYQVNEASTCEEIELKEHKTLRGIVEWNSYGLPQKPYHFLGIEETVGMLDYKMNEDMIELQCSFGQDVWTKVCPWVINKDGLITTRIKFENGCIHLWVNNLLMGCVQHQAYITSMQASQPTEQIGYTAYKASGETAYEAIEPKAIPGRFDGVFCLNKNLGYLELEERQDGGLPYEVLKVLKSEPIVYRVTIKESGHYHLFARLENKAGDGFVTTYLGIQTLEADQDEVSIILRQGSIVDYFEWVRVEVDTNSLLAHEGGVIQVVKDGLPIKGHIRVMSANGSAAIDNPTLITKLWGLGCGENRGMAFFGHQSDLDYTVELTLRRDACETGEIALFVRVTKESLYDAQVRESLMGYRLLVKGNTLELSKLTYMSKPLVDCQVEEEWHSDSKGFPQYMTLLVRCIGAKLEVLVNNKVCIQYEDTNPYLYGKAGFEVLGESYGVVDGTLRYHQKKGANG